MAEIRQLNPDEYSPARKQAMEEIKITKKPMPDSLGDTLCCPNCKKKRKIGKSGMQKMFKLGLLEKYRCMQCRRKKK